LPAHLREPMESAWESGRPPSPTPPALRVVFGMPAPWPTRAGRRTEMAARLIANLGANVKVVTGHADALYGNFGNRTRFTYSVAIAGFGTVLAALGRTDYGRSMEI